MRIFRVRFIILVVIFALAYWCARHSLVSALAGSDVTVRPYVMHYVRLAAGGGSEKTASDVIEYRRRDGSVVEIDTEYTPAGLPLGEVRRVELSDGVEAIVVDSTHTRSTTRASEEKLAARKSFWAAQGDTNCVLKDDRLDGEETIYGHRGVRIVRPVGADSRMVLVRLPDFNCVVVTTVLEQRTDSNAAWRTGSSTRLISFAEVDPPESAFTDWTQYEEVSPSEARRRYFSKAGITPAQCPACFSVNHRMEADYNSHRP